ncbi:hypothetical protein D1821_03730 [Phaeobacter inhibens]|uniref:hypothetical protein n=1 Tax=Phaeobacter inhibens TaxID=221822 RepID=UPI000160E86E|nr:hypothetical protein [Phaeobacter inhibens]AFO86746.1 hypothetical protein PGA2_c07300 [Phaeobacter inhibens 2.10]AXT41559.1 hypothetical protein D1821_03730 [Phaeobacter inhibens]
MTNPDSTLWQSAQNIQSSQQNLNKLYNAFALIECSCSDLAIEIADEDATDGDFLQAVWNCYFYVKRSNRANAKITGTLTLAIQLTSDEGGEIDWEHGKRAKVLVGYTANPSIENAWVFLTDAPNTAGYHEDCVPHSLHWTMDDFSDPSWFYALPLDQLTNASAVRELIVTPVHDVLRGGNVEEELLKIEKALCQPPKQ